VRKALSMLIPQPNAAHMLLSRGGRGEGNGAEAITGRERGRVRGRSYHREGEGQGMGQKLSQGGRGAGHGAVGIMGVSARAGQPTQGSVVRPKLHTCQQIPNFKPLPVEPTPSCHTLRPPAAAACAAAPCAATAAVSKQKNKKVRKRIQLSKLHGH
jgi:hypothetical protein